MKKKISILLSILVSVVMTLEITANENGIGGKTGAPTESNCRSCHGDYSLNSGGGTISITHNIPVSGYALSTTYTFNVTVAKAAMPVFGFDCEILNSSNASAGTLIVTNSTTMKLVTASGRSNITHKLNGGLSTGTKTFTFNWTSPSTNVGNLTIYAAGVAGNNNGNESGDYVYTTTLVLTPASSNTIATGTISASSFCQGTSGISIPFTASGTFVAGNIFTAQLSNASGSFASPTNIGTLLGQSSGTIVSNFGLPAIAGTLYRIRVVSSNPVVTGTDNGANLTIDLTPTPANAGIDQIICGSSSTFTGNAPIIGSGTWSLLNGSGIILSPNSNISIVNQLGNVANSFIWTIANGACSSSKDTIVISKYDTPSQAFAGSDQLVCSQNSTLAANIPAIGNGAWSTLSGSGLISNINNPNSSVSGLSDGINLFIWTISNGICAPSKDTVKITKLSGNVLSNAGSDQIICSSSGALNGNVPSIGNGTWTLYSGSATIDSINSATSNISNVGAGINSFIWTISNGVCLPVTDTVLVIRKLPPTQANAGLDQTSCSNSIVLNGNSPLIGEPNWQLLSGGGNLQSPNSAICQVNNLGIGSNQFIYSISNAPCLATYDTMSVIQSGAISIANAGSDQTICMDSTNLIANTPANGKGIWLKVSGSGVLQNDSTPVVWVKGLSAGSNKFIWKISNGTCNPSIDTIAIVVNEKPSFSNAGIDQTICNTSAQLNGNVPTIGTGTWSISSGSGTISNPNLPNTTLTGLGNGNIVLNWTISNGVCTPNNSSVVIHNCNTNEINTQSINPGPYCLNTGYSISVPFTYSGIFNGYFTAELSDSLGGFSHPIVIGSGNTSPLICNLATNIPIGNKYRIRVKNSYPAIIGSNNPENILINTCDLKSIKTGIISGSPFCKNTQLNLAVPFTYSGYFSGNFVVQLSDEFGTFNKPVSIGSGNFSPIFASIPTLIAKGSSYRIRVVHDASGTIGEDNGINLEVNTCNYISIDTMQGNPFCRNTSYQLNVNFVANGDFSGPYSVELSNLSGDFTNPVTIGYGFNSPITTFIPSGTTMGYNYRIRVVNNNSGINSNTNYNNLYINTCNTNSIETEDLTDHYIIYPNPVSGKLYIMNDLMTMESLEVKLFNLLGEPIPNFRLTNTLENTIELSIDELFKGMAILQLKSGEKVILRKVFIQ